MRLSIFEVSFRKTASKIPHCNVELLRSYWKIFAQNQQCCGRVWDTGFEAIVDPNILKLVAALQREQTLADTKYVEMVHGKPPVKESQSQLYFC